MGFVFCRALNSTILNSQERKQLVSMGVRKPGHNQKRKLKNILLIVVNTWETSCSEKLSKMDHTAHLNKN